MRAAVDALLSCFGSSTREAFQQMGRVWNSECAREEWWLAGRGGEAATAGDSSGCKKLLGKLCSLC